ncbi:phosphotransferase family protein [Sphingomonas bacterium]|uniref:phosphotransferase family protein n=1 Tax=Sphingomonas bacterium TaxID=1895847 RepID=UPI0020C6E061|nr:phosphotransferase family protein [Sphingomonas bacterium]
MKLAMPSDLDEDAVRRWIARAVPDVGEPAVFARFAGGQSNPTYRVATPDGDYVLRRKPFGALLASAHAVDREYRLLSALYPTGFAVPRPVALCTDDGVIGTMFYLMEMVDGRVFWDGGLPDLAPAERGIAYRSMVDTLAALHAIDPVAVGLADFGRSGNPFARQIDRWTRQYRASQTEHSPEMEALIAWLPSSIPASTRTTIVHGDYRLDNLVYANSSPTVAAVLDWELATTGDPLADFAYLALNWVLPHTPGRSGLGGLELDALAIPTLEQVTAQYCGAAGLASIPPLQWYFAFNLFRGAGILQGIAKRMADGNAAGVDAAAAVDTLPGLIRAAWSFARQAGAPDLLH